MKANYLFCIQILSSILLLALLLKDNEKPYFSYNFKQKSLESCQSLNIPCLTYTPSLWEIEQISGISLLQATQIKHILDNRQGLNKNEFIKKLLNIKGIGKKKSNKIADIFYY